VEHGERSRRMSVGGRGFWKAPSFVGITGASLDPNHWQVDSGRESQAHSSVEHECFVSAVPQNLIFSRGCPSDRQTGLRASSPLLSNLIAITRRKPFLRSLRITHLAPDV
jgi:hypothetical protein